MGTFIYIIIAILIFGILIAGHEWGHFIVARLCGVRVLEFSIGMGPLILQRESKKGTKISWRALPIGGFCALQGEQDEAGTDDDPASYANAALWKKVLILCAGAAMNFLIGLVLIFFCFSQLSTFSTPTITSFFDGCPYEGEDMLMVGDTFYSINGHRILFVGDISTYLAETDGQADIVVIRDGKKVHLDDMSLSLLDYTDADTGETIQRYGFHFSQTTSGLGARLRCTIYCAEDFVRSVWKGLEQLITGAVGIRQMSGVVGIVDTFVDVGTASETTYAALLNLAYLTAFIAINLAVMNMLPIPALDGGQIFLLVVVWLLSKILHRQVSTKFVNILNGVVLVLLMGLMIFLMFSDVLKIISG